MQDIHPIGSGGGRTTGIGDRRQRPYSGGGHQALKCPRCESLNTKFCYYNNYNLSQPRHFCKNCRRYWTKGGVLRNVPVGGGCRKSKRSSAASKPKHGSKTPTISSHSSSDSSTTSANNPSAAPGAGDSGDPTNLRNSHPEKSETPSGVNVGFQPLMDVGDVLFPTDMGEFMSLGFSDGCQDGTAATTSFSQFLQNQAPDWEMGGRAHVCADVGSKMQGFVGEILDPRVRIDDLLQNKGASDELHALDWQTAENAPGLFDLPVSTVDQQTYWSQTTTHHSQWSDNNHNTSDHPLFLP